MKAVKEPNMQNTTPDDINKIDFFARWKMRFGRGLVYTSIPMTLFSAISMSFLWKPYLDQFGIPAWLFYFFAPASFVILTLVFGYYDDIKKIFKKEMDHYNRTSNSYYNDLLKCFKDIEEIKTIVNDLKRKQE